MLKTHLFPEAQYNTFISFCHPLFGLTSYIGLFSHRGLSTNCIIPVEFNGKNRYTEDIRVNQTQNPMQACLQENFCPVAPTSRISHHFYIRRGMHKKLY